MKQNYYLKKSYLPETLRKKQESKQDNQCLCVFDGDNGPCVSYEEITNGTVEDCRQHCLNKLHHYFGDA